jgi:hypothetical protein
LADGLASIINQLERQRAAIEKALAALRAVEGEAPAPVPVSTPPAIRQGAARNRRSEAQKARWAAKKAGAQTEPATAPAKAARKGGMTEEGRQRLAEAMKRRWAVKRAGSAVKKRVGRPKKAA